MFPLPFQIWDEEGTYPASSPKALPQQSKYLLLHGVSLRQRGNAGLVQDGELGHVRHFLSNISCANSSAVPPEGLPLFV